MLADEVGLGKTRTALAAVRAWGGRALILAPASLRAWWQDQAARAELPNVRVTSHAMAWKLSSEGVATLLVVDEAHHFRNAETRRSRALWRLVQTSPVLLLTATPLQNTTDELLHLLRLLHRTMHISERALPNWVCRSVIRRGREDAWALATRGRLTVRHEVEVTGWDVIARMVVAARDGAVHADDPVGLLRTSLLHRLASSPEAAIAMVERLCNYLERLQEAVLAGGWLTRDDFEGAFGREPAHQLAQQVFPFFYKVGTHQDPLMEVILADRIHALRTTLRALSGCTLRASGKGRVLDRVLSDHREGVLLFTEYRSTARALAAGWGVARLDGSGLWMPEGYRVGWDDVTAALPHVAHVAVTPVGSEGLNLQHAHVVVHVDQPWNPARLAQRVGRVDRMGQARRLVVHTLAPPRDVERWLRLESRLSEKRERMHRWLDAPDAPARASLVWDEIPGWEAPESSDHLLLWLPKGDAAQCWLDDTHEAVDPGLALLRVMAGAAEVEEVPFGPVRPQRASRWVEPLRGLIVDHRRCGDRVRAERVQQKVMPLLLGKRAWAYRRWLEENPPETLNAWEASLLSPYVSRETEEGVDRMNSVMWRVKRGKLHPSEGAHPRTGDESAGVLGVVGGDG